MRVPVVRTLAYAAKTVAPSLGVSLAKVDGVLRLSVSLLAFQVTFEAYAGLVAQQVPPQE